MRDYDAVVVGASLAGCTTAILLGRAGARVALVERQTDVAAFKRICSHHIQASGVPTLERLGLRDAIAREGGRLAHLRVHTRWGWIEQPEATTAPACLNLRRERLDPLVRRAAAETPGVELLTGLRVTELLHDGDRVAGVVAGGREGEPQRLRARLVVGADGRDSTVADLAGVPVRHQPLNRFAYGAYFEGPEPAGAPDASTWFLDPQWGAAFPTDAGLTFYAAMPTKELLPAFKADPARALVDFLAGVPDPPPVRESRMVGTILGKLDMPNVTRRPVQPGLALAGDAALAADPLWGVGCGWALQSGEWLADSVAPGLLGEEPLDRGLDRYRRRHARGLRGHMRAIESFGGGRKFNGGERFVFSAAVRDARVAETFEAFGTRRIGPGRMLARALPRALAVHARARVPA